MTDAIKALCEMEQTLKARSHFLDKRCNVELYPVETDTILAAIRDLEGVASGQDKIVPVEREYICQSCHRRIEEGAREDAGF